MPVFFWLLDTSVINAWTLAKISTASPPRPSLPSTPSSSPAAFSPPSHLQNHRNFLIQLAHALTFSGYQCLNSTRAVELEALVSATSILPANGRHCLGAIPLGNNHSSRRRGNLLSWTSSRLQILLGVQLTHTLVSCNQVHWGDCNCLQCSQSSRVPVGHGGETAKSLGRNRPTKYRQSSSLNFQDSVTG